MTVSKDFPQVYNFDGESLSPAGSVLGKLQQNTYWPGWRTRWVDEDGNAQPMTGVKGEIRTKPLNKGGLLIATIRCTQQSGFWWKFDLPLVRQDDGSPIPTNKTYVFDIDVIGPDGEPYTPFIGTMQIIPEVTE